MDKTKLYGWQCWFKGFFVGFFTGIIMLVIVNIIHKYVLLGGTF